MASPVLSHDPAAPAVQEDRYRCGTLKYTVAGLAWAFVWLLWGDFVFSLMETVVPSIIPLYLRKLEASDFILPIIMGTVPSIIGAILNPTISTASDRYRGRLGRRIPFLLFATPCISAALVFLAFMPEAGAWFHARFGAWGNWSLATMSIFVVGLAYATFKVFDMFINTVFWYLFNDVVPHAFMNRFMGLFRFVGGIAGMLYNFFFFEHAITHMRWIFLGVAGIYFLGFTCMCTFLKEGQYPPPDSLAAGARGIARFFAALKTYFTECCRHRIYVYFFVHNIFFSLCGAVGVYDMYLNLSLGITEAQIGRINAVTGMVALFLNVPVGWLADRFHPLRICFWMEMGFLLILPLNFVWWFGSFTPQQAYHIMIGLRAVDMPISMVFWAVQIPMMMRIFPKDRFGQFCSFNALCGTGISIFSGIAAGWFMTRMHLLLPDALWGKEFHYRTMPFWRIPLMAMTFLFLFLAYRQWRKLGGEKSYSPPGFAQPQFRGSDVLT